jgi:hypothetical protein
MILPDDVMVQDIGSCNESRNQFRWVVLHLYLFHTYNNARGKETLCNLSTRHSVMASTDSTASNAHINHELDDIISNQVSKRQVCGTRSYLSTPRRDPAKRPRSCHLASPSPSHSSTFTHHPQLHPHPTPFASFLQPGSSSPRPPHQRVAYIDRVTNLRRPRRASSNSSCLPSHKIRATWLGGQPCRLGASSLL